MMTTAVVGLGSSLGDRRRQLTLAVHAIDALPGTSVVATSRIYRSAPLGAARRTFLNAAVRVETRRSPRGLLAALQDLERRLGRRPSARWADRAIDLDLLLHGRHIRVGHRLTLPHAGLLTRAFALVPACEVGAELVHPCRGVELGALDVPRDGTLRAVGTLPRPRPLAGRRARRYGRVATPPASRSHPMKIFLDTANISEIREAVAWGIVDGVTTNPSLIAREGGDFCQTIAEICDIVQGPVSAETVSVESAGMVKEGRLLAQISEHIVVKVPLTAEGLKATRVLSDGGIDVNVTLCFQASQALLAAKAGAAYVSPFLGRLDDISHDGIGLIEQIVQIYANYPELGTEVLAASIRHPSHFTAVAMAGADVSTLPWGVLQKLVKHPLTDSGLKKFLADWDTVPDNNISAQVERFLARRGT
jgi:transaldolase